MQSGSASGYASVGRLFWMMLGPAILFLLAVSIARDGGGWFTLKDVAFLSILGAMVVGRIVEFQGGDPRTATGEPATRQNLRQYATMIVPLGLAIWVIVNLIGNR